MKLMNSYSFKQIAAELQGWMYYKDAALFTKSIDQRKLYAAVQ